MAHLNRFNNSNKDYSSYPPSVVTHSESESVIICSGCNDYFNTDPWRKQIDGQGYHYSAVTNFIVYNRLKDKYFCLARCNNK